MDTLLLLARLILAAVFVVAGVAKLADPGGSRKALEGFGVPARLALPGSILLPLAEIAVGLLLLPRATAQWAGIGALILLLSFVGGIAYNLARGRTPDCHCFGQLHSEPVGWPTVIRNGALAAVAAFLTAGGWGDAGPSVVAWIENLSTGEQVLSAILAAAVVALIAEGWLLVHLLSQNGRVLLRLDTIETMVAEGGAPAPVAVEPPAPAWIGLPEGSPAPAFRLEGLHGETMTLDALRAAGKQVMLIFSDPNCGPCNALLPDLGRWQRDHASKMTISLISRGKPEANKGKAAEHGLTHVLLQQDREVAQAYQAHGTPSAVIVRADGMIGSAVSAGAEAIRNLVSKTTGTLTIQPAPPVPQPAGNGAAQAPPPPAPAAPRPTGNGAAQAAAPDPRVGQPAPAISLPDLAGKTVSLAAFKGDPTLLLFWNPGCGFCRRMVDDLKAWEANPPQGAPKLLIVSTGEVEANTSLGLASPTLLDQGFATGRAYGASGTPSAVLVDKDGKIASGVAVGAPGVLALANGEDPKTVANGGAPAAPASKKGQKAPAVKLPDLEGNTFDLSKTRGGKTLLVFWNPGCGFCRRMVDDLKAFEASPPKGAPKVVLVSTGTVESNKEFGLKSTTLLDDAFATGRAYGASGTPSAVLIDAKGNVASDVAVGAPGVLALAGVTQDQAQAV